MPRILRIVSVVFFLALWSHAVLAQEPVDTARVLAQTGNGVGDLLADAQARAKDLGRKIEILGDLSDAADSVSAVALGQSLSRARQKVEEARREAAKEPPLEEPVLAVVDIVSHDVTTPPFGMPADQLRARLFVEIGKLEEEILRQTTAFQNEANTIDSIRNNLERISASLRSMAVAGDRASLAVRRMALKGAS
jgi:hypothetical protein